MLYEEEPLQREAHAPRLEQNPHQAATSGSCARQDPALPEVNTRWKKDRAEA